jgi:hypothetical protein
MLEGSLIQGGPGVGAKTEGEGQASVVAPPSPTRFPLDEVAYQKVKLWAKSKKSGGVKPEGCSDDLWEALRSS